MKAKVAHGPLEGTLEAGIKLVFNASTLQITTASEEQIFYNLNDKSLKADVALLFVMSQSGLAELVKIVS